MKNLFFAVIALTLLATSCAKDPAADSNGKAKTVSFTVKAPEINTRAFSAGDGSMINKLYYAFYDANGNLLDNISKIEGVDFTDEMELTPTLIEGRKYKALFWAHYEEDDYKIYNVDLERGYDVSTIMYFPTDSFGPEDLCRETECYDAFWANIDVIDVKPSYSGEVVTLKRPFAQLNIGAPAADIEAAAAAGVSVGSAMVGGFQSAALLTLSDGTTDMPYSFTYSEPQAFSMDNVATIDGTEYVIMATAYILIDSGTDKALENVTFTTYGDNGNGDSIVRTFKNVPLQRNYRTYILGNILTSNSGYDYVVNFNPGFGDDN